MDYNNITELREAANGYLSLLQRYEFCYDKSTDESVNRLHKAIADVDLGEIGKVLARFNVNRTTIISEGVEPTLRIIEDLGKEIGNNMPTIIKEIDPEVGKVFMFCKEVSKVLVCEYEKMKSRRFTDPTFADDDAVERMRLFDLGYYGELSFNDFIKEYIIKDEPNIAVVRRLNYMISQSSDEQVKRDLRKFLCWRKCDEDAIKELHDTFGDFYRLYDHTADVSPIPSDDKCNEVTTRLFSVIEWCKQHDKELRKQLEQYPLAKGIEDLNVLATNICESPGNWFSIFGNDTMTIELINDIAYILDNHIKPTIKHRNPTSTIPSPSVEATIQDNALLPDFSHMVSYQSTIPFDMLALYSFLINEGVINNVDEQLFTNCITHAHINELWESSHVVKKHKRNLLQCLFKMLSGYYPEKWITECANNLNVDKKRITNPTRSRSTIQFTDKLIRILKGK